MEDYFMDRRLVETFLRIEELLKRFYEYKSFLDPSTNLHFLMKSSIRSRSRRAIEVLQRIKDLKKLPLS